jgi:hypothetical protein
MEFAQHRRVFLHTESVGFTLSDVPGHFFSADSFSSLAGASGIVFVVCNALQGAFNFNPRWLALALAQIIAIYGAYVTHNAAVPSDYFVVVLNGCLIYCTSVGGTTLAASARAKGRPKGLVAEGGSERREFFTSWF